jgi:hypothetical protein
MLLDDRLVHPRFAHCSQYHNSQLYKTILNERFVALIPFLATRDHDMHRLLTGSQPLPPKKLVPCKPQSPENKFGIGKLTQQTMIC